MTKLMITALAFAVIASQAQAAGPRCSENQMPTYIPVPAIVNVNWSRAAQRYPEFYSRCGNYIADLTETRKNATRNLKSRTRTQNDAAEMMIETLNKYARTIPYLGADSVYPQTIIAIKVGSDYVNTLKRAAVRDRFFKATASKLGELKWLTINRIYDIVENAYYSLDSTLDVSSISNCDNCSDRSGGNVAAYGDGLRELAQQFLNMQNEMSQAQASDNMQINLTGATASGAKSILMNSLFRRKYSCAILELDRIELSASKYVCSGSDEGYPLVELLDEDLRLVNLPVFGCAPRGNYRNQSREEQD